MEDLEPHVATWEDLAAAALEPNVFQEPWMLLPGWRAFGAQAPVEALLIYTDDRLDGIFAFERRRRVYGLPFLVLKSWRHQYNPLGTPLVRATAAHECLSALFDWLAGHPDGAPLVEFVDYAIDGPFHRVLADVLQRRGLARFDAQTFPRAVLRRGDAVSPGHLKELRRQRRRLEESGHLELRALQPGADLNPWIRTFLDLERAGWKGRAQTALACHAADQTFFEHVARGAHSRGRLRLLGLFLDDRPIAMKCNLIAPPGSFAWKIAFDEEFARFSPGVQLELDNVEAFHREQGLAWMDSCATEGHAMIDRLWRERRAIARSVFSTGRRTAAEFFVSALGPAQKVYRQLRMALHGPKGPTSRRKDPTINPQAVRRSGPSSRVSARIARAARRDPAGRP